MSVCFLAAGATINLDFTPDFDLQKYQDRLVQELLSQVLSLSDWEGLMEPQATGHICQ